MRRAGREEVIAEDRQEVIKDTAGLPEWTSLALKVPRVLTPPDRAPTTAGMMQASICCVPSIRECINAFSQFAQEASQGLRSVTVKLESGHPPRNSIKDALQGRGLEANGPIKAPLYHLKSTSFGCQTRLRRTYKPLEGRRWRRRGTVALWGHTQSSSRADSKILHRDIQGGGREKGRFGCRHHGLKTI